jgi:hypothetical protein
LRVGALDVSILVDAEGSFATIAEAFPALSSDEEWRLPINAVLIRGGGTTVLVDTGLGPEPRAFMPGAGARLLAELARAGGSPDEAGARGSAGRALQRRARLPSNREPCRSGND